MGWAARMITRCVFVFVFVFFIVFVFVPWSEYPKTLTSVIKPICIRVLIYMGTVCGWTIRKRRVITRQHCRLTICIWFGWVWQILYQTTRSKYLFWYWGEVPCLAVHADDTDDDDTGWWTAWEDQSLIEKRGWRQSGVAGSLPKIWGGVFPLFTEFWMEQFVDQQQR